MDRSTRTNSAKLITTLRGPNGCYASVVLPNRRPSLYEREQLPGTLEDRWLVLQCPQQNDSSDYLQCRDPIDERSEKERHDQDHDNLVLL
ncbi:MAG: hypothetical protein WBM24_23980 [Candidatus Sulfotelmatobacter sp.]